MEISVPQAASVLGVSEQRVLQLISQGRLKARKAARDWLLREAEVSKFAQIPRRAGRPKEAKVKAASLARREYRRQRASS